MGWFGLLERYCFTNVRLRIIERTVLLPENRHPYASQRIVFRLVEGKRRLWARGNLRGTAEAAPSRKCRGQPGCGRSRSGPVAHRCVPIAGNLPRIKRAVCWLAGVPGGCGQTRKSIFLWTIAGFSSCLSHTLPLHVALFHWYRLD